MNKITLYQTNKSEHLTCRDQIELCQFSYQDITPIRDSQGEFIIDQEVKKLQYPIQKYVFSQKDWKGNVEERIVYAAFDNELLELIQCERSKFQNLNDDLVCKVAQIQDLKGENSVLQQRHSRLENECLQLKSENDKVRKMSFWERLVFYLKGLKVRSNEII